MTIGVCMGTYNGEEYITEQLQTILQQTKKPDRVILCDDGSTDGTVERIQQFVRENHLEDSWTLYQNESNKGYPENFYYAMGLCETELVFLADQDDVWHPEKLRKMAEFMEQNPKTNLVCCRYNLIDATGKDLHSVIEGTGQGEEKPPENVDVRQIFYKSERPGMVLCYRNAWYKEWAVENSAIPHDFLLCAKAAEEHSLVQINQVLAFHRRHDHNAGKEEHRIRKLLNKQRKIKEIREYLDILEAFAKEGRLTTPEGQRILEEKTQVMLGRLEALLSGKYSQVVKNAKKNKKFIRPATFICDMIIVKGFWGNTK